MEGDGLVSPGPQDNDEAAAAANGSGGPHAGEAGERFDGIFRADAPDREQLEAGWQQLRLLAEAGRVLESSLEYEQTLKELGNLIVPAFADWFAVDLVDDDGEVTNIAVAHVDPTKVELAHELRRRYPPRADDPAGTVAVARSGRSQWYPEIPDELLATMIEDPELLEIMRGLGLRSGIVVPLVARTRSLGAMTMIMAESGRLYSEADVDIAEQLARRAGLAIENAMLFEAEHRANARMRTVARVTALLSRSLDADEASQRLAELITEDLADFCLMDVLDEDTAEIRRVSVVHRDPSKAHLIDGLLRYPPDLDGTVPAAIAMRTRTTVVEDVRDDVIEAFAANQGHLALIRQIGGLNFVAAPLIARGRVLGAMTVSSTSRRFESDDVELINEVASRAALHLDNTRLFAAQRDAVRQARRLQSIVDSALTGMRLEDLLRSLLERVVAEMGTDLADILLMDEDEPVLRIRAAIGLDEEVAEAVTVPIGQGFAGRIAASRRPMVVEDMANYDVVSPYLRERVKSAVGVPLLVDDEMIGVMHTSSTTTRTFDDADVALLVLAAERAALAIRRADLYERQERIASMLQEALTPVELPDIPHLDVSVLYRAAGRGIEAGGDFYDLFQRGRGEWSLVVGDVCGRGTRAAAVTGLVRGAVRALATLNASPGRVLEQANEAMVRSQVERFCTAAYATIHPVKRGVRIRLARAGHPPPLVLRSDGTVEEIYSAGALIGVFANLTFEEVSLVLGPGDAILLYTDGLVERSPTLDAPGALARELGRAAGRSAAGVIRHLADSSGVAAGEQHDDVVILVARVLE